MDKSLLSLTPTHHSNPLQYPSNDQKEIVLFKGITVKQKPVPCRLTIEGLPRYPTEPNGPIVRKDKTRTEIINIEVVSIEEILQGGVLEKLFHEQQGGANSLFLSDQKQSRDSTSKITSEKNITSTQGICYCSNEHLNSACKLPDVFIPQKKTVPLTKHIAYNRLTTDHLKRIGIEIETGGLAFINTTPWFKGQILARTTGECFGYPLISITAEISNDLKACPELVTAPLTETQLQNYHIDQKLKKLKEIFADFADEQYAKSFGEVINSYNQYILEYFKNTAQIDILAVSGDIQYLPYKEGRFRIEAYEFSIYQNDRIDEIAIIKTGELPTPIFWCHQHNFFIPYSRLGWLCKTVINENNAWRVLRERFILDKTARLIERIKSIFMDFSGIEDVDWDEINAFLTNHAYVAYGYYCQLACRFEVENSHINSTRYICFSLRVSLHQEMMEIFSNKTVDFFNKNADKNKGNTISERLINEMEKLHFNFNNPHILSIYKQWLRGYWQEVFECAHLRKLYGKTKVMDANTDHPYITSGKQKIPLPLHAATATKEITDIIQHYYFVTAPMTFNNENWVVMELRMVVPIQKPLTLKVPDSVSQGSDKCMCTYCFSLSYSEKAEQSRYFPFSNSDWMVKKTVSEQHFLNTLWGHPEVESGDSDC